MDLQYIINCLTALHLNTDVKNETSSDIENILKMLLQYKKDQALQLQQAVVVGRSEQLVAYEKFTDEEHYDSFKDIINQRIKDFIATN